MAEAILTAHGRRAVDDEPAEARYVPHTHADPTPPPTAPPAVVDEAHAHAPASNDPTASYPPVDPRIQAQLAPPAPPPATPAEPTASPQQLAMVDLALSDPLNQELVQAYAPNSVVASGDVARDQVALYGAERFSKMQQLAQATESVRNQYITALDAAQQAEPPTIVREGVMGSSAQELAASTPALPVGWHYDVSVDGEHTATFRPSFDVDTFTAWYAKQDTLASRAFAALYGGSQTSLEAHGGEQEIRSTSVGNEMFHVSHGYWSQIGEHGEKSGWIGSSIGYRGGMTAIDAQGHPDLIDSKAVWFDPSMGFVTSSDNIKQKQNFFDKALPSLAAIGITAVTAGAGAFSSIGTAAGGGLTGAMASAAAASALTTLNTSLLTTGSVHLKDILKSALTGAVTAGITQGIGLDKLGLQGNTVVSYADRAIAITGQATLQGALQQIAGGKFKDGFTAGLASGLAAEVTRGMQGAIDAKVDAHQISGAEASAYRLLTQATGSAIRMLSNPNDPGHAMAEDFLGTLVQDGATAAGQPAPMSLDEFRQSEHTQANEQAAAEARMATQSDFRISEITEQNQPPADVAQRRREVEEQVLLDIRAKEARDDSLEGAQLIQTGGAARSAPRGGIGSGGFEMVRNGNWDAALNLGADTVGLLGEIPNLQADLAKLSIVQAEDRINTMRQAMMKAGVKNVPDGYVESAGTGADGNAYTVRDYAATVRQLEGVYENHVRDQRLRETWGDDYKNVRIGKSQMTVQQFEQKVLDIQQRAADNAYTTGVDLIAQGKLEIKRDYASTLGNFTDVQVRDALRAFASSENVYAGPGANLWAINRRIQSEAGIGIPDNRLGFNLYADTTLARKSAATEQIIKWNEIRPGNFLIIRPSTLGGPYVIPRASIPPLPKPTKGGI